jgi:hypothetical protein
MKLRKMHTIFLDYCLIVRCLSGLLNASQCTINIYNNQHVNTYKFLFASLEGQKYVC